jgi:hypothetical protein
MVLEMELRAMSDWASDSSTTEVLCMLWTLLAFLESASRGSSWQRCPMLRLIHLVHGLSYPQRQWHVFEGGRKQAPFPPWQTNTTAS